jgi:hypothetical protein
MENDAPVKTPPIELEMAKLETVCTELLQTVDGFELRLSQVLAELFPTPILYDTKEKETMSPMLASMRARTGELALAIDRMKNILRRLQL